MASIVLTPSATARACQHFSNSVALSDLTGAAGRFILPRSQIMTVVSAPPEASNLPLAEKRSRSHRHRDL